jgi:hypothetical protein
MTGLELKAKVLAMFDQWATGRDPAECAAVASDIAEDLEQRATVLADHGDSDEADDVEEGEYDEEDQDDFDG